MPFSGLRVLSFESRRAKEMEALIVKEHGIPFVAPSVQERAIEDQREIIRFVERLEAGEFDMVICMTGVGISFLCDVVAAHLPVERLAAALRRVTIVSRGPKPVPVLREMNVRPSVVVAEPNTWTQIVDVVAARPERRIAVQEYGRPNLEMNAALERLGAHVTAVPIYRWQLPDDVEPLRRAARALEARQFDVVLFTSSIQLDHLREVARDLGIENEINAVLSKDVVVASVGPVMTASLQAWGLSADVEPIHPKMAALVRAASTLSASILLQKRKTPEAG